MYSSRAEFWHCFYQKKTVQYRNTFSAHSRLYTVYNTRTCWPIASLWETIHKLCEYNKMHEYFYSLISSTTCSYNLLLHFLHIYVQKRTYKHCRLLFLHTTFFSWCHFVLYKQDGNKEFIASFKYAIFLSLSYLYNEKTTCHYWQIV